MQFLRTVFALALCCQMCHGTVAAAPIQGFADGLRAFCEGKMPVNPEAATVARFVQNKNAIKAARVLSLRDAVERSGIVECALLDALIFFQRPPAINPVIIAQKPKRKAPSTRPSVQATVSTVLGSCNKSNIERVVYARMRGLTYCYQKERASIGGLKGTVEVSWRIGPDGKTSRVAVDNTTLSDRSVERCATRQIRRWRFKGPSLGTCDATLVVKFGEM